MSIADPYNAARYSAMTTNYEQPAQTLRAMIDDDQRRTSGDSQGTKQEETTIPPPVPDPAMYCGLLGEIVQTAAPHTEADPVAVLASLLAGVGVIMGPTPHVLIGSTRHPLLVWPLLFGSTGTGRKGESWETAALFLLSSFGELADHQASGLSSGEGLIERLRDPDPPEPEDGKKKGKQPGGTDDKRLIVIEEEFASVMARAKREGSTLASVLRQAWGGKALSVLNRSALRASSSHAAIIGHVTPREFRIRLAETELAGGTYNRFLPLYVERSQRLPMPEPIPEQVRADLGGTLRERMQHARKIQRITLGDDAEKVWREIYYDDFTAADDEDTAATEFTRRAAPYSLRIAATHAVLDGRGVITSDDLCASAALVRYAMASAAFVLDRQVRDPRLDRIRRAVDQAGVQGLTRTDVSRLFSRNLVSKVLDELLTELLDTGHYERFREATGGRPAERYRRVVSS